MATYHCSKKAFSRCPYKRFCGSAGEAEFYDGSECAAFNQQVENNTGGIGMKPWQNSEGYNDPTAYSTIKAENAREAELARLVKTLKYVIGLSEFELVGRIVLRDKDGREYR